MEAVAVADIGPDAGRGQRVVVAAALRKKARSGSVGRADAGANVEVVAVAGRGQRVHKVVHGLNKNA